MDRRRDARFDQRMACRLEIEDRRYPGVVADVSTRGLFVWTPASAPEGAGVLVRVGGLRLPHPPVLVLESDVARAVAPEQTPSGLATGLGLSIERVPEAWRGLLAQIAPADPTGAGSGVMPPLRALPRSSCSRCGREGSTLWHGICGWCGGRRSRPIPVELGTAAVMLAPAPDAEG